MRKRPLGKTGLVVSEMAIGTWGLSGDAYGPVDEADAEAVLRRAVDIGISLVDTSDAYGAGRMEKLVGKLLRDHPHVLVASKIGVDRTTDPPRKNFGAEHLRHAVDRSLRRLGIEAIPILLLHGPSPSTVYGGEAVDVALELKKAGKIRHWGIAAGDEDGARAAMARGAEIVELAYNLTHPLDLHRLAGDVMVEQTGILARSVLAHGLLAGTWDKDRHFPEGDHRNERWTKMELEHRVDNVDALRFLVKGEVPTLRAAAVRFALEHHLVSAAVLGPRTIEQLEQLVRETGGGPRYIPDDDMRQLPRVLDRLGIRC